MADAAVVLSGGARPGSMPDSGSATPVVRGRAIGGLGPVGPAGRVAASPLVPPLLLGAVAAALGRAGWPSAPGSRPCRRLAVLASTWAIGEALGTWRGGATPPAVVTGLDGPITPRRAG